MFFKNYKNLFNFFLNFYILKIKFKNIFVYFDYNFFLFKYFYLNIFNFFLFNLNLNKKNNFLNVIQKNNFFLKFIKIFSKIKIKKVFLYNLPFKSTPINCNFFIFKNEFLFKKNKKFKINLKFIIFNLILYKHIYATSNNCEFNLKIKIKKYLFKKQFFIYLFFINNNLIKKYLIFNFYKKKLNFYKFFFKFISKFKLNTVKLFLKKNNFTVFNLNLFDNFKINLLFKYNFNIYNNQYPIIIFKNLKNNFFLKFDLKKKFNFLNLINIYLLNFFEFFFKNKFFLKISNNYNNNNSDLNKIDSIFKKYNKYFFKINKFIHVPEMIEIIWISFKNKDLIFFKNWLIKILNLINLNNHKFFFSMMNEIISNNFNYYNNFLKVNGFYLCVRGKISLSGNAKKKTFFLKKGSLKISSKNSKIENQKFDIKTNSGSLGINIILSY